jgi:predicted nucleic acid-binding protein
METYETRISFSEVCQAEICRGSAIERTWAEASKRAEWQFYNSHEEKWKCLNMPDFSESVKSVKTALQQDNLLLDRLNLNTCSQAKIKTKNERKQKNI